MSLQKHIFKVGAWTAASRVLGFARDMLFAAVLGAGRLSDIFLAAFKLPNLFRDLLGEGALSAVFVPMFAEHKNRAPRGPLFASNVFSWLMAILLLITVVALIAMPLIIWAIAPGFAIDPGKMESTILLARLMFGYVILICGAAFLGAILNAFSEFAIAAMMPALTNIFMILGLGAAIYFDVGATAIYILAAAVMISGIVQFAILWARIRARRFGLRLIRPRITNGIKTMVKRMGTTIVGSGFYQINILIGTLVASFQSGAVTWLYYADRMVQLPFAVVGLAAGTVLLTSISDAISAKKMETVYAQQNAVMRQSMMFVLPSMVGLFVLATPIMQFIFERGAWTHESTIATATAIMILCLALPAMTTSQVYSKTLYASQDVKTPVRTSMISLGVSAAIFVAMFPVVGFLSVPIGVVVGGYLKNWLLLRACRHRNLFQSAPSTARAITVFGALSAIMGVGLYVAMSAGMITGIFTLIVAIAAGGVFYMPLAYIANKKIK